VGSTPGGGTKSGVKEKIRISKGVCNKRLLLLHFKKSVITVMINQISLPDGSAFTAAAVQKFRDDTEGTKNVIHFNNAGAALMPGIVVQAQLNHIKLEAEKGGYEAAALLAATANALYSQFALLLNCTAANIAFTCSATDAYTKSLSSIPFEKGDIILTDCDDYVSNQIQFLSLKKRLGIQIVHIRNAAIGGVDVNDLETQLHKLRPKLLAITHIPTNSGLVQPVAEIASVYKAYSEKHPGKTWYILDACQSTGQMKLDVQQLGCDFLSATCRKFLRGPRGSGVLYVSDRVLQAGLEPLFIDMRGAEWTAKETYTQEPGAKRFEHWEFSYSALLGTKAAIDYCLAAGEDKIWQQVKLLSAIIRQKLSAIDRIRVLDRGPELCGLVTFYAEGQDPVHIVNELLKRKINVSASYRAFGLIDFDEKGVQWAVRASPHYYNTPEEIDTFIEAVREVI
jgi:selenocysteine lyase/cysteine desulfurase